MVRQLALKGNENRKKYRHKINFIIKVLNYVRIAWKYREQEGEIIGH